MKKYAYAWLTLGVFAVSFAMHWLFGWFAYVDEVAREGRAAAVAPWLVEMSRDTFENWQSEFLQLLWQVVGLAYFLYVGSPASKENDDRLEAKVDALLELVGHQRGAALIEEIDRTHLRRDGHAPIHRHPPYEQAGDLGAS